jgi:hypothetical protein
LPALGLVRLRPYAGPLLLHPFRHLGKLFVTPGDALHDATRLGSLQRPREGPGVMCAGPPVRCVENSTPLCHAAALLLGDVGCRPGRDHRKLDAAAVDVDNADLRSHSLGSCRIRDGRERRSRPPSASAARSIGDRGTAPPNIVIESCNKLLDGHCLASRRAHRKRGPADGRGISRCSMRRPEGQGVRTNKLRNRTKHDF